MPCFLLHTFHTTLRSHPDSRHFLNFRAKLIEADNHQKLRYPISLRYSTHYELAFSNRYGWPFLSLVALFLSHRRSSGASGKLATCPSSKPSHFLMSIRPHCCFYYQHFKMRAIPTSFPSPPQSFVKVNLSQIHGPHSTKTSSEMVPPFMSGSSSLRILNWNATKF